MIPFGKNILAMTAVLPIALQQGASVSYDAVVNGVLLFFTAFCFYMNRKEKKEKREIIFAGILSVFIAVVKGGALSSPSASSDSGFCKRRDPEKAEP